MALQYVLAGNVRGAQGPQGEQGKQGPAGVAGAGLHVANVDVLSNSDVAVSALSPAAPLNVNDLITDVNGDLYTITSIAEDGTTVHVSAAVTGVSFKGPQGVAGAEGPQGAQGAQGAPFQIAKLYASVDEMNGDYGNSDIAQGAFVLINTGNVQDEDNAKLYVKGSKQYDFVTDLSGSAGIQGPEGPQGPQGQAGPAGKDGAQGAAGAAGKNVLTSTETPRSDGLVSKTNVNGTAVVGDTIIAADGNAYPVTEVGDSNYKVDTTKGVTLKGAQGEAGPAGAAGPAGPEGPQGAQGEAGPAGPAGASAPAPVASQTEPEDKTAGKLWIKTDADGNALELYIAQDVA